jgi:hypothetical protein
VFDTLPGALEGTFKEEQLGTILLEEGDILWVEIGWSNVFSCTH